MKEKEIIFKLSKSDKSAIIPMLIFMAVTGGISLWLYLSDNGFFIFTALFFAFITAILIHTVYCLCFVKILVYEDGFLYQPNIFTKKHFNYSEISEAWDTQKHYPNNAVTWCFNFKTVDGQQFSFMCPMNQADGIDYMLDKINN